MKFTGHLFTLGVALLCITSFWYGDFVACSIGFCQAESEVGKTILTPDDNKMMVILFLCSLVWLPGILAVFGLLRGGK